MGGMLMVLILFAKTELNCYCQYKQVTKYITTFPVSK